MTGGVLGGLIGAAAALLIPGIGPVVAGGILASALGGAALGAAGGGLMGGLITTGVPEDEARYYDQQFQAGRTVVTVKADGKYAEAEAILRRHGASFNAGAAGATTTSGPGRDAATTREATGAMGAATSASGEGTIRVPEVEERLTVEKRQTQQGEVQIRNEVTKERQTVPIELQREEVHVERRDVGERPVKPGEGAFEEGTIRVPVRGEEAVVTKEAVVTGEVVVNKERTTEHEEVSDTVRRTSVKVDESQNRQGVSAPGSGTEDGGANEYRQYAQEMRRDSRYTGRRFEEVETALQKDWAQRHPGTPWEKAKAAVREAWTDAKGAGR